MSSKYIRVNGRIYKAVDADIAPFELEKYKLAKKLIPQIDEVLVELCEMRKEHDLMTFVSGSSSRGYDKNLASHYASLQKKAVSLLSQYADKVNVVYGDADDARKAIGYVNSHLPIRARDVFTHGNAINNLKRNLAKFKI